MTVKGVSEIKVIDGLVFRSDGRFYNGDDNVVGLRELPEIYQGLSRRVAESADERSYVNLSIHEAMRFALDSFAEGARKVSR